MRSYQPAFEGDSHQINLAIEALLAAKRPVFYVGGGVIQADAEVALRA
jgi:acetolactate synthase-1/2/3 large subunit